ncbi:MAG: YciI family protein [Actinoallomurus sp.]
MMYMLLFYSDDTKMAEIMERDPEPLMNRHLKFNTMVQSRTRLIAAHALQPNKATVTIRPTGDDERQAVPGPASESRVVLNGFYLINCKDMDEAVEIAREYPMPEELGYIEVRPIVQQWKNAPIADSTASVEAIWSRYADFSSWPDWMVDVESVTLNGLFTAGTTGEIRMTGGIVRPLRLVTVKEPESFTMETGLANGIWLWSGHYLTPLPDGRGTRITHEPVVPHNALEIMGLHFTATVNEQAKLSVDDLAEQAAPAQAS